MAGACWPSCAGAPAGSPAGRRPSRGRSLCRGPPAWTPAAGWGRERPPDEEAGNPPRFPPSARRGRRRIEGRCRHGGGSSLGSRRSSVTGGVEDQLGGWTGRRRRSCIWCPRLRGWAADIGRRRVSFSVKKDLDGNSYYLFLLLTCLPKTAKMRTTGTVQLLQFTSLRIRIQAWHSQHTGSKHLHFFLIFFEFQSYLIKKTESNFLKF